MFAEMGHDCVRDPFTIKVFNMVYGSFILLFGKLFYDSVLRAGREKKEKMKMMTIKKTNGNNNNESGDGVKGRKKFE